MKKIIATAIALLAISSAAHTADNLATEPGAVFSWTGGYIGGQIGYGFGNADYVYEGSSDYDYSNDPDGFLGGIYAGYNHQFANGVVLGLEADVAWGGLEDAALAPGDSDFSAKTSIDLTGSARLRLGYAMDRLMPYVAGGVAFGKFNFTEYDLGDFYASADESMVGWTLGVGAEYALTDNWTLRGEYRYADYGTHDFVTQPADEGYSADIRTHDVRFGVAYKF